MKPTRSTSSRTEVLRVYEESAHLCRVSLERLSRRDRFFSALRVIVFLFFIAGLVDFSSRSSASPWWLLIPVFTFIVLVILHAKILEERDRTSRAVGFYEKGIGRLKDDWMGNGYFGENYPDPSHLYAADLDLFGKGSLFELLCAAKTPLGQERLAQWFLAPAEPEVVRSRQEAVSELIPNLQLREDLARLIADPDEFAHPEGLIEWAANPPTTIRPLERCVAAFLSAVSILAILAIVTSEFYSPFLLAILMQMGYFLTLRKRILPSVASAVKIRDGLMTYSRVLARLEKESFSSERLTRLTRSLEVEAVPASVRIRRLGQLVEWLEGGARNMMLIPFARLVFWSTHLVCAIEKWRSRSGANIPEWIDLVAEIEALCCLAGHAYENPDHTFPEILDTEVRFEGIAVGHPLLPAGANVPNDIRLDEETRLLIVSGSNMSGKSTLLRSMGANAVLGLAGGTVRAQRLSMAPFRLGASIRIQDSLQEGISKFYREVKRIGELIDLSKGTAPTLLLVDEIFHGTNSQDRRIAAEAVARSIVSNGALALVTTHDLALTEIAKEGDLRSSNVHFEDQVTEGNLTFDYKLRPGATHRGNALILLRSVGLDV